MDPNSNNTNPPNGQQPNEELFAPRYATPNQPQAHGFTWQREEAASHSPQPVAPTAPAPVQLPQQPQMPQPSQVSAPQQQWQPTPLSQAGPAPNTTVQSPGIGPQYGGPMAELPPLAAGTVQPPSH